MTTDDKSHRNRLALTTAAPAQPDSLIGTYFLGDQEHQWQGCVVAEPAPGVYLVELFDWFVGASSEQKLVRLADMTDWEFFDDAEWMRNTYNESTDSTGRRWEPRGAKNGAAHPAPEAA